MTVVAIAALFGKVASLKLKNQERPGDGVLAGMEIDRRYRIPRGSKAIVLMQIMGQPQ